MNWSEGGGLIWVIGYAATMILGAILLFAFSYWIEGIVASLLGGAFLGYVAYVRRTGVRK